jgi:TRAP-type C4-dicarboxylate transport system substrate-binding protein
MKLLQNVINHKINTINREELLKYATQYNISLTTKQADAIVERVKGKNINIFDAGSRSKLVKELAKSIGPVKAKEINQLFMQLIR